MSPRESLLHTMPRHHRTIMFWVLTVFFFIVLPIVLLYTSGYRLTQSENGDRTITTIGGLYVAVFTEDVDLYVDNMLPSDRRPFSSAFYVQGYSPGTYEVRTQGENVETWVKELPIYPHIVTQAFAFNLPRTPVIRLITPYSDRDGNEVLDATTPTSSTPLAFASSTNTVVRAATERLAVRENTEYTSLRTLFASTTQRRAQAEVATHERAQKAAEGFRFPGDGHPPVPVATTTATTTVTAGDMELVQRDEDVFARWIGNRQDIPHYFCAVYQGAATTTAMYGAHVHEALVEEYASSTGTIDLSRIGQRLCRSEIRLDRKWQTVQWFDFMPGNSDLVLLHLEDGLYVVEIDDRAWQNVQLLYPGEDIMALIDAGSIFIEDGDFFLEVFTEIP